MQLKKRGLSGAAVILALLAGCETEPEDIAEWKAEKNSAKLVKTLSDPRQFIRLDAIDALGGIKAEGAVHDLGKLLKDPDPVIVHRTLDALAAIGTPAIEPYMLQAITFETGPARLTAAKALGELASENAVDPLIEALNDKYETVAVASAVSLGRIGDARAIPALAETSGKGSVPLRESSVESICRIGGEAAVRPLLAAMGDVSEKVRSTAAAGLVNIGAPAESAALQALRSENNYERQSALAILAGIKKVPEAGGDLVWYRLAGLTAGEKPEVSPGKALKLAEIDEGIDALIEALSHPSYAVREYAFLALETIGEPAAAPTMAATADVMPEAQKWFESRNEWAGAPAWELDFWAAATALNPGFEVDKRHAKLLGDTGKPVEDMLKSENFHPRREVIPLLIGQMAGADTDDKSALEEAERRRKLAVRKLRTYRQYSKFPLLAALDDEDLQIASHAAEILAAIGDRPRTTEALISSFAIHIEAGTDLHDTPFYDVMIELDMAEADELIRKVRPNPNGAICAFRKKYPGIQVSNIVLPPSEHPTAAPFRLKYLVDGKARELKVIFRPDADGNWVPEPPFPDELM